jgi:hypothetical protein
MRRLGAVAPETEIGRANGGEIPGTLTHECTSHLVYRSDGIYLLAALDKYWEAAQYGIYKLCHAVGVDSNGRSYPSKASLGG